jgi:putative heme iron utilization protein
LEAAEADIVDHMNADHADAVQLYASKLLGFPGEGWRMTGCDAEGCDLRLGGKTARLDYDKSVSDAKSARVELVRLAKRARR